MLILSLRASLLALGLLAACSKSEPQAHGSEVLAYAPEAILDVVIRAPEAVVSARRFRTDKPFLYTFQTADGRIEHCRENERLNEALLSPLKQVRAFSTLTEDQSKAVVAAHKGKEWTTLEVRDESDLGETYVIRLLPANKSRLYAQRPWDDKLILVDRALLGALTLGCGSN